MNIARFDLEFWLNPLDSVAKYNFGSSCCKPVTVSEMLELTGTDREEFFKEIVDRLNGCRNLYLDSKKNESPRDVKNDWWQMIQLLPSSYNQRRTVMLNYEVLTNIYHARRSHKLDEWAEHNHENEIIGFCDWIKTLPYSELITEEFNNETIISKI